MCRLAGYVGPDPVPLSALFYDAPHSLEHAAYAPTGLLHGHVNVDGSGVAWWPPGRAEPLRYVTELPPWADPNLPRLAPAVSGTPVLAAVRSATPGMSYGPDHVAPFVSRGLTGVHNGWIGDFRQGVGRTLIGKLSDQRFGELTAINDSLTLFLLVAQQLDDDPGRGLARAVTGVVDHVAKVVEAASAQATLNLVVSTSREMVAVRTSVGARLNSLYTREGDGGYWVASEPLDPAEIWEPVPEHSLVVLTPGGIDVLALGRTIGAR